MLYISLTTAALSALVNIWISVRVVQARLRLQIANGDGGDPVLLTRMRAHANFSESVPLPLILIALIEMSAGQSTPLMIAGGVLIVARLAHPIGMDRKPPNIMRAGGMLMTAIVTIALALWALILALNAF